MSANKAPANGTYTIDGVRFLAKAGEAMPPGAVFDEIAADSADELDGSKVADPTPEEEADTAAKKAAQDAADKAKADADAKAAKKAAKTGPLETTTASGPSETLTSTDPANATEAVVIPPGTPAV